MITSAIAPRDHVQSAHGRSRGMTVFQRNSELDSASAVDARAAAPRYKGRNMIFRELTTQGGYWRFFAGDAKPVDLPQFGKARCSDPLDLASEDYRRPGENPSNGRPPRGGLTTARARPSELAHKAKRIA